MASIDYLLGQIRHRDLVLPEFQREFTWKRGQSRDLIDSLLKGYPTGSLLLWKTDTPPALKSMEGHAVDGQVDVLLDGQQRLTVLYMLIEDDIPPYYNVGGIASNLDPRNLYYNLETRELRYYKKIEMENNPRWIKVTAAFKQDEAIPQDIAEAIAAPEDKFGVFARLSRNYNRLQQIRQIQYPIMHVKQDAELSHALDVFHRVNSGGTPLTDADIALAHMCSSWAQTRRVFKNKIEKLAQVGFRFDLTFLVRAMNAVITGRAEYQRLHDVDCEQLRAGWSVLDKLLDYIVNFLKSRAYIYGTDDLNTLNVLIPLIGYLTQSELSFTREDNLEKMLYWLYAALFQRRYSGSVDQKLERDLVTLEQHGLDGLIAVLLEDEGSPQVSPENLDTRGVGHPFYNMSCIVIRANGGVDWSNGLDLSDPIGDAFSTQRHHIFPKSLLSKAGYDTGSNLIHKKRVNEIANRVPLTFSGNMDIFNDPPAEYLEKVDESQPGNLSRFMIPTERQLWEINNYEKFLAERRRLIAEAINNFMAALIDESSTSEDISEKTVIKDLINNGENDEVEFKSTLRWHMYAERMDKDIEHAVLKTLAAFMNTKGGTLLIGVNDEGEPMGLEHDKFSSHDNMMLHLVNIVRDRIGTQFARFIQQEFELVDDHYVLRVNCRKSPLPAFVTYQNTEHFYIRTGPSTSELQANEIHPYIDQEFHNVDISEDLNP